jgi:hypothetical protein
MSFFSKVAGAFGNFFQLGGPLGPGVNNNAGTLEALNSDDVTYTDMRALLFEFRQTVPSTESLTILTGNTVLLVQDWTQNGHVVLQGTARLVWVG